MKRKRIRRVLTIAIIISMFVTSIDVGVLWKTVNAEEKDVEIWDGTIADSFAGGSGTKSDPYVISTASELAYVSKCVNDGEFNEVNKYYFSLDRDIYLNKVDQYSKWGKEIVPNNEWIPIGNSAKNSSINFEGNNHTIYGLYINSSSDYVGLFGYINRGKISNLNIRSSYIATSGNYVGAFAGEIRAGSYSSSAAISNCYFQGRILGSKYVGGITGYAATWHSGDNVTISHCKNYGDVRGFDSYIGGINGYFYSDFGTGFLKESSNFGNVEGKDYVGGITGGQFVENSSGITVEQCFNGGNVTGEKYVAGIVALTNVRAGDGTNYLKDSYNIGDLSYSSYGGGIVGLLKSYSGEAYVLNCYTMGRNKNDNQFLKEAGQYDQYVSNSSKRLYNCYLLGTGESHDKYGVTYKYITVNEFKKQNVFEEFDFDKIWVMSATLGRPILRNNIEETDKTHSIVKDFSEYPYRADVQMDMSIPSSKTWKNVIDTESACKQISEALDDEGMRTTAYWWKLIQEGIASVDNPEEVAEISFTQKDMYKAIIFNSLLKCKDIEFKDEDIGKSDGEDTLSNIVVDPDIAYGGLKTVNKVTGIVTKWAKTNGELSLLEDITSQNSSRKWSTLSLSQQEDILKDVGEFYDNILGSTRISEAIKFLNKVGTIAKVCDTVVDCIEYISNYIYMYQMTDSQKAAVYTMYQVCPSDNQVLKSSLKEVYDILTSSQLEFIESITSGTSMVAGRVVTATWLDLYWKSVKAKIVASCPYVMIFWAAIKTTTFATNVLLGTNDAVEAYYNMLGMKEFHSVAQAAYNNLQDVYVASESAQDAETYITATNILYHCIDQDYEYALNYLKPLDKSFVNKVSKIFGKDSFDATMSTLKNYQSSASSAYNTLLYAWIYELENDYPEEYQNYKKYLDSYEIETVKSYRIACPVDVYIYDSDNQLVGKVENNVPYVYGNEVTIVVENDIKTLYFAKESEKYHLKLTGTDIGKMDIEIEEYSKGQVVRNAEFYDVPLEKELSYTLSNDGEILQKKEYLLSNENSGETISASFDSLLAKEKQKHVLKVNNGVAYENDEIPTKTMEVYEGQKIQITSIVNNKQDFLGWKADDSSTVFEDATAETTFVIIGNTDVSITASYKNMADSSNTSNPSVTEKPSETASPVPSASVTSTPGNSSNPMPTETSAPTVTPSPEVTNIPDSGQISTPTQKPSETTTIPDVSDTSTPNTPSVPITSETPTPGTTVSAQPDLTPTQTPSETTTVPSASATIEPSVVPTLQPSETASSTPTATVTATPKSDIIDSDDSNKNQTVAKGCTFIGSSGTALYKITKTGKSNTVSYVRNLKKSRKTVKIPSVVKYKGITYKVTAIGKKAFYKNIKLKKVVFGKNITNVDANAFYKCNKLKTLKLNEKLSKIGDNAFAKCIKLQYIVIPKGVRKIGKRAFYGCKNLKYILIKSNQLTKKQIGKDSFAKGYKKVRVKTSKKKRKLYSRNMIHKGKMSSRAIFVAGKTSLVVKK